MKTTVRIMRMLGGCALLFGALGLCINGLWLIPREGYWVGRHAQIAYRLVIAVDTICYIVLMVAGVQLIRVKGKWLLVLVAVLAMEILTFLAESRSLLHANRESMMSIEAAMFADMGMTPQLMTFFPIWGIVLAMAVDRRDLELRNMGSPF